ncbi:MAG: type IV secretory system conjugative DNA transfer family protein [Alphaproteobacteria bacterium]|nr:type IV secretory system conjugative DNA transfer family protein [Rhodospirillales bacterium]MCW9046269.1 type IV secretory system conjugative DNA transfer family protein [Alphaproteobacteria bacterium]
MIVIRVLFILIIIFIVIATLWQWNLAVGFNPMDSRWWSWLIKTTIHPEGVPTELVYPLYWSGIGGITAMFLLMVLATRSRNSTVSGGRKGDELHGSARWAEKKDVKKAGLFSKQGVTVGGWPTAMGTKVMRHDGPEHLMVFAPTRSGKGVSLIIPTLLTWKQSAFVLDIKGENYALTSGWRKAQGQNVYKFEPTAIEGSAKFNPLSEVRIGTGKDIADCQNIASMIIDPDGKGKNDYWQKEGFAWLSVMLLHVICRVATEESRMACLDDVNTFASGIMVSDDSEDEDNFTALLDEMIAFDHGEEYLNKEVQRGANRMKLKAGQERSGVHSTAIADLALYADPIIAKNTASSDFRIYDLVNGKNPTNLYMVIPPSDLDRLRPLIRIFVNLMLRRLTEDMTFEKGRSVQTYKHRLLLMLDEFTSIGKLPIMEKSLAFMAGYGLKAFIVVQDITQLREAYGREESIMSNCHIRIAFAPNKIETAEVLSKMAGKTTIVQKRLSRSGKPSQLGSISESYQETGRALLTADECLSLRLIEKRGNKVIPGDALIFAAGSPPIKGKQRLYFQDKELQRRAEIPASIMGFAQTHQRTRPLGTNKRDQRDESLCGPGQSPEHQQQGETKND